MKHLDVKLAAAVTLCLGASGCFNAASEAGVAATIIVDESSQSDCVKLKVEWDGGSHVSPGVPRSDSVLITVGREPEMVGALRLQALGFEHCDAGQEIEWGPSVSIEVPRVGVKDVELRLGPVDKDGDGKQWPEDCDDRDPAIPAASEVCTDNRDHDCDGTFGCADGDCVGMICSASGGKCQGSECREHVESLCGDGVDNDSDGLVDCEDTDCDDGACDDGRSCTQNDLCTGGACTGTVHCDSPPGPCFAGTGSCDALGACQYEITQGASCDDSNECSAADQCLPDAGCLGQPLHAVACSASAGVCENGSCAALTSFPFQPANFDAGSTMSHVNPALTIGCSATVDTSSTSQTICGVSVKGQLVAQASNGPTALVIAFRTLTISQTGALRAVGPHPVILAVYGNATLDGALDVGSVTGANTSIITIDGGAGSNVLCGSGAGQASNYYLSTSTPAWKSWGGGGGGAFGGAGGKGGSYPIGVGVIFAGAAGTPTGSPALQPLLGGCPGGSGGTIDGTHGSGGLGGGAIELSAAGQLQVNQWIQAGGAGGVGGDYKSEPSLYQVTGGGGGGAGGGILLEAQSIVFGPNARITAHGGGGGRGGFNSGFSSVYYGTNGENGRNDTLPAAGGGPSGGAGEGGSGGTTGSGDYGRAGSYETGRAPGGGGGGTGRIRVNANASCIKSSGALISPPPTFGNKVCQ